MGFTGHIKALYYNINQSVFVCYNSISFCLFYAIKNKAILVGINLRKIPFYRALSFAIVVLVGAFLIYCCNKSPDNNVKKIIKVGILFPTSGSLADKGRDSVSGATLAIEEVNAAGGIRSLGGAVMEPVYGDTEGNPDKGAEETERLINKQGVVAIIGTYQSSVTKVATQVAERLETPFIVSISLADIITERGFRYTFRIQPKAEFYARDQARFLKGLYDDCGYKVKRVALLHENTDFGTSTALAQKKILPEHGIKVLGCISYSAKDARDLTKEVSKALALRPDAIVAVTYLNDSILIRRAMLSLNADIPFLDTAGGTVSPEYVKTLGRAADGTLTSTEYSKYAHGAKELNDRFLKRFGVDITGDSAYAYQAILVLKDALERAGTLDKKRLRDAIAATDMPRGINMILPAERLRFNVNGENAFGQLFICQIQKGELVPVWPKEFSVTKIISKW